jgi:hypothetical protein
MEEPLPEGPEDRAPCPRCGSMARDMSASGIFARGLFEVQRRTYVMRHLPWLVAFASLTLVSSVLGAFVFLRWWSLFSSLVFSVISGYVGYRAISRVPSTEEIDEAVRLKKAREVRWQLWKQRLRIQRLPGRSP